MISLYTGSGCLRRRLLLSSAGSFDEQSYETATEMYTTSTYRSWRSINVTSLRKALRSSTLFTVNDDDDIQVEQLASLNDGVIDDIADRHVPLKTATCRSRPSSDPWYDDACREARRRPATRHPEFADDSPPVFEGAATFETNGFWRRVV